MKNTDLEKLLYDIGKDELELDTSLVTKAKEEISFRNFYKVADIILGLNFVLTVSILIFLNLSLSLKLILISYLIFSQGLIAFSISLLKSSKLSLRGREKC